MRCELGNLIIRVQIHVFLPGLPESAAEFKQITPHFINIFQAQDNINKCWVCLQPGERNSVK